MNPWKTRVSYFNIIRITKICNVLNSSYVVKDRLKKSKVPDIDPCATTEWMCFKNICGFNRWVSMSLFSLSQQSFCTRSADHCTWNPYVQMRVTWTGWLAQIIWSNTEKTFVLLEPNMIPKKDNQKIRGMFTFCVGGIERDLDMLINCQSHVQIYLRFFPKNDDLLNIFSIWTPEFYPLWFHKLCDRWYMLWLCFIAIG